MRQATLTALKKSIKTWERRAAGEDIYPSVSACALCTVFYNMGDCQRRSGGKCPIYNKTGHALCVGTGYGPYERYYKRIDNITKSKRLKKLAQAEVDFLKSLLPDEKE